MPNPKKAAVTSVAAPSLPALRKTQSNSIGRDEVKWFRNQGYLGWFSVRVGACGIVRIPYRKLRARAARQAEYVLHTAMQANMPASISVGAKWSLKTKPDSPQLLNTASTAATTLNVPDHYLKMTYVFNQLASVS